jgi:hypothetical protein
MIFSTNRLLAEQLSESRDIFLDADWGNVDFLSELKMEKVPCSLVCQPHIFHQLT